MNIQPTGNRVLVERLKTTDITAGGLYIPENAKEKANVALVLAVSKGRLTTSPGDNLLKRPFDVAKQAYREELLVKAGDRVLFGKYSGVDFEHEGKTLLFLREDEIFAILLDNVSPV